MSTIRQRIIAIALEQVGSKGGARYGHDGLWCGAFVCWCLREAGLDIEAEHPKAGENLCTTLPVVSKPEPGDIVRYQDNHCAIVLEWDSGVIHTVDGSHSDESVKVNVRWHTQRMSFYSISELIRCQEMTGARTSDVI